MLTNRQALSRIQVQVRVLFQMSFYSPDVLHSLSLWCPLSTIFPSPAAPHNSQAQHSPFIHNPSATPCRQNHPSSDTKGCVPQSDRSPRFSLSAHGGPYQRRCASLLSMLLVDSNGSLLPWKRCLVYFSLKSGSAAKVVSSKALATERHVLTALVLPQSECFP